MTTYYLAFKPYAELLGLNKHQSAPSNLVLARTGWTDVGIYRSTSQTDFFDFASSLSSDVQRMGNEINRCLSSRTTSLLLLLTSGGLVVYLLLR